MENMAAVEDAYTLGIPPRLKASLAMVTFLFLV
jgi:hypothetical protein